MNNYYEEDIVDIKDLIKYILSKWRHILIGLLIGLLLGSIFSFYKASKTNVQDRVTKMENNIDQVNIANINKYVDTQKIYEDSIKYNQESILMKLDSGNVYISRPTYSCVTNEDGLKNIKKYLNSHQIDDDLWKEFLNKYSINNVEYVVELLDLEFEYTTLANGTYSDQITVYIYGETKDFVKDATIVFDELITRCSLANDVTITKINESIYSSSSSKVSSAQSKQSNNRKQLLTLMSSLETNFNEYEKTYYSYNYDYDNFINSGKASFSKKWPVFLGAAFSVLVVGIYFFIYLFSGQIKTEDEINNKYKLSTLATIDLNNSRKNTIDKFIDKLNKPNTNDYSYLKSVIKNLGNKKILLCNEFDEYNDDLKKLDKRLVVCGTLDSDEKAIDALKGVDGVILTNKYWKTTNSRLQKQIDILNKNNKEIIGVINYL